MALLPTTNATAAIITKGLTCGLTRACENGTSITAGRFSLFCGLSAVPASSGGSRPYAPGEIGQLYQPVPPQDMYYVVDRSREAEFLRTRVPVIIKFEMGEYKVNKEYLVPEERARVVVKVVNMLNVTKERITVTLSNIKRTYSKAKVKLSNFRLRR